MHPRDPRARRGFAHPVDPAAAAIRLEVAAASMRADHLARGPELTDVAWVDEATIVTERLAADVATAVQLGTVAPPLTAQAFADALGPIDDGLALEAPAPLHMGEPVAESEEPAPVAPMPPVDGAPASAPAELVEKARTVLLPEVFSSERHRHTPHRLNWRSRHDERSRAYGVRATLPGSAPVTDRLWPVGPVLDQGVEGACVGFGLVDAINATAAGDADRGAQDAERLYKRAQQLDAVPGEDYSGTSVLAGLQAAVEAGLIGGYLWAFGTRDVAQAVLQRGPVVIGVPWLSGMYDTGPGGLLRPVGEDTGAGHCLAVVGLVVKGPQGQPGPYFVLQNSWGPSWGVGGLGYIHHRDLAALLHGVGEAAIPTRERPEPSGV